MKNRPWRDEGKRDQLGAPKSNPMKRTNSNQKPKHMNRGLSLEAFANAKSNSRHYNPASIKKQKEFYKNAKCVSKFKKLIKRESQPSDLSTTKTPDEDDSRTESSSGMNKRKNKRMYKGKFSLGEIYKKKHEEEEKARIEREAVIQAKKEEKERVQAQRKATKEKMFKKTRSGQPVMKYRIERLLESIQGSQSNS